jgi:N-acetylglucosaminyl-diphospho-decaprenol L-rhamnosyltransferase
LTKSGVMPQSACQVGVDLSVSIISYRTPALLQLCLEAIGRERSALNLEVIVVDNASGDGSPELVETRFPWVRVIRNDRNLGFGAAHNQALRLARGRYWLVLNSDAVLTSGAAATLVDFMDAAPDVAVAGPMLRHPGGSVQSSRRRFPTVATLFVESTQVQRFWPENRVLQQYYVVDRRDDEQQDVDWLVGACLCVRAAAATQVGLFDERFFMYSEELDWCRRFRAAGWRVVYVPSAEVRHLEGGSSRLDLAARDRMFQASKLRYAAKWHGAAVGSALRAYLVAEYLARAIEEGVKLVAGSRAAERRARLRLIGRGLRSVFPG